MFGIIGDVVDTVGDVVDVFDDVIDVPGHAIDAFAEAMESVADGDFSDLGHSLLDMAGMVPVWGDAADLINAGWYAAEGDYEQAAESAAAAIPGVGNFTGVVK